MINVDNKVDNEYKFIGTGQIPQVHDKQVRWNLSSLIQVPQDNAA